MLIKIQKTRLGSELRRSGLLVALLLLPVLGMAITPPPAMTALGSFYFPFKDGDSWTYEVSDKLGVRFVTKTVLPGSIDGCTTGYTTTIPTSIRPAKILQGSDGSRSYVSSAAMYADAVALCYEEHLEPDVHGKFRRISTEYASDTPLYFFWLNLGMPGSRAYQSGTLIYKEEGLSVGQGSFSEDIFWVATEDVAVPAGTFRAEKFAYTIIVRALKNNQNYNSVTQKTIWVVLDIGIVKEITATEGETSIASLTATNFPLDRKIKDRVLESPDAPTLPVVEFYNTALDHYFLTADPAEMVGIDNGAAGPGWTRTGLGFDAYTLDSGIGEKAAVCRFYGDPKPGPDGNRLGPNSHFYTANAFECEGVRASPGWMYEALAFSVNPAIAGMCEPEGGAILAPVKLRPVYRAYNNRHMFNDSNHRYTTDVAIYQQMMERGWIGEGVVFCVP